MINAKLAKIYYGSGGYWKGVVAIKKLAKATQVPEDKANKYTCPLRGAFLHQNSTCPNPTRSTKRTFFIKYALAIVNVASRYKEAKPLTLKNSDKVAQAFQKIYKGAPLKWPQLLQVDPGCEFMGAVTKDMENHKTYPARVR